MRFYAEIFDKPYPYRAEWDARDNWIAKSRTKDGKTIKVVIRRASTIQAVDVIFSVDSHFGDTEAGDAFRVYATLMRIVVDYMDDNLHVKFLEIYADEESGARGRIYGQMAQKYAGAKYKVDETIYGYEVTRR